MGAMVLEEKTVQIRDDFDPDKILESGQCFRPRKQAEGWYRFVSGRQLLYLRPLRSGTYTVRCEPGAWETFWHGYFDLGRSYAALRGKLDSRDDFLQRAMEYGRGIRVLRQDEWEMLVSFIISQRKSIPAIRRAVELLSERFGERLGSDGEGPVYAFPTAEALCCAGEQALQECGLGYRTRYVLHAAQQAAEGTLDLKKLASLPGLSAGVDTLELSEEAMLPVLTQQAGILRRLRAPGDAVFAGDILAEILDSYTAQVREQIKAPAAGRVFFARRAQIIAAHELAFRIIAE